MACSLVWACKLALLWVELRVSYRREAKASGRLASVGWVSSACTEARVSAGGRSLVLPSVLEVEMFHQPMEWKGRTLVEV